MPGLVAAERLDELHRRAAGAAQARMLREIAEALEALSIDAPVVLTLDDLQWSDPSTIDLVAMLARRREPARLLVVASYRRSELPANSPLLRIADDLIAHRTALSLRLEPFDEAGLAVFLAQRFPRHAFPSELAATVHRATGGSPLFVATLVEDLLARGMIRETEKGWELTTDVAQVAAQRPDGVRRLIDMQIDRLGAAQQRILEAASVAGITFTAGVVAHALDAQVDDVDSTCETLAASHRFLQYVGTETWPDGTIHARYAFEHALIQHAALARNPSASVRLWHRKIAERLEAGYAGREMVVASELAVHFEHGQRPAQAARYYVKAGERAARRFGNLEAVAHFERALALVATLPEGGERDGLELQASFALGQRLFPLRGGGAKTVLERARDLAVRLGDETTLAGVLVRLQMSRAARGDIREAVEQAAEVARVVEKVGDANLRRLAKQIEVVVAVARGHLAEARALLEDIGVYPWDARRRGAAVDEPFPAIGNAAIVSLFTGRPDEALALGRRMFEIGEATGNPFDLAAGLCEWARVFAWRGEPAKAEELSARSLAMAEEGSFAFFKNRAQSIVLWARAKLGTASAPMLEALCEITWDGGEGGVTLFAPLFADACWRVGLEGRALEVIEKTLALAERSDERIAVPELYRMRGEILKAHDKAEAERAVKTAIELARLQGSTFLEMRAHRSLYALATGATKKHARDEIARLLATFTEGFDTRDVLDARAIVGGV
jgi:tetratricopeptide (TPR) repeat protein